MTDYGKESRRRLVEVEQTRDGLPWRDATIALGCIVVALLVSAVARAVGW